MSKRFFCQPLHWGLLLMCLLTLCACGKKEWPQPDNSAYAFSWQNVRATQNELGCLTIAGVLAGNFNNLEYLVLEVQPYDLSCEGCPFVPQESRSFTPAQIALRNGSFYFSYCPSYGNVPYRWRLIGHNTRPGLPDIQTPARLVGDIAADF